MSNSLSTTLNVKDALYQRLVTIFKNPLPVLFSFSGGKDSLIIAHALETLVKKGQIDKSKLTVIFIDEEAMYEDVIESVTAWRLRFMMLGVKFDWYCLPWKHFNCFDSLQSEESWMCWDPAAKDVWIRPKPDFAITEHPNFRPGMTYQDFLAKVKNAINLIGVRAKESVQRMSNISRSKGITKINKNSYNMYPIYDWDLNDVWLYIRENNIDLPITYKYMWEVGVSGNKLRISQMFSIDTASSLVQMVQFYPDLYDKILKRSPNAYLAMYYFDTQMFRRHTKNRNKLESEKKDFRKELMELMANYEDRSKREYQVCVRLVAKYSSILTEKTWSRLYDALYAGDPKLRTLRAVEAVVMADFQKRSTM